jgi:hypothetical protein
MIEQLRLEVTTSGDPNGRVASNTDVLSQETDKDTISIHEKEASSAMYATITPSKIPVPAQKRGGLLDLPPLPQKAAQLAPAVFKSEKYTELENPIRNESVEGSDNMQAYSVVEGTRDLNKIG